ncbi:MAG TPA: hypothetical protein VM198_04105 [Longimicrobiales bacterium]|nr:hypothetical protein [Longimicrobiales bacterium]
MIRSHAAPPVRVVALGLLTLGVPACASAGGGGGGDPNIITREQVLALPEGNAYTVVQRYRAGWLRARSRGSSGRPDYAVVFRDELQLGDLDSLRRISTTQIDDIEFIDPLDATTRYGTGYIGGIIRINTLGR